MTFIRFKTTKEKYNTRSGRESKDDKQSAHNRHVQYRKARRSGTDCNSPADCHDKSWLYINKELSVFRTVNNRFKKALEYRTSRLADIASHYDHKSTQSAAKWFERLQGQMRSQIFD